MAKFYGPIGYGESVETPPGSGVYRDAIVERNYLGDVERNSRRIQDGDRLNKDVVVDNSISVVADAILLNRAFDIRYIKWLGTYWTVSTVETQHPRLRLWLGEVYNGPTAN